MPATLLAFAAATWGVVMAIAPLLQVRRMLRRRSSDDVSVGYLALLVPGFCLWVAYGVASGDIALVVPNTVATLVASLAIVIALRLRRTTPRGETTRPDPNNGPGLSSIS